MCACVREYIYMCVCVWVCFEKSISVGGGGGESRRKRRVWSIFFKAFSYFCALFAFVFVILYAYILCVCVSNLTLNCNFYTFLLGIFCVPTPLYWLFRKYFRIALSSSISVSVTLDGRVWRRYSEYSRGINFHIWMLKKYLIWKYLRHPVAVSYLFLFKNDLGDIGANILGSALVFYWISVRLQYFLSSNFVIFYYFYSDILSYWLSLSHTNTFTHKHRHTTGSLRLLIHILRRGRRDIEKSDGGNIYFRNDSQKMIIEGTASRSLSLISGLFSKFNFQSVRSSRGILVKCVTKEVTPFTPIPGNSKFRKREY